MKKSLFLKERIDLPNPRTMMLATLTTGSFGAFLLAAINIDRFQMFGLGCLFLIALILAYYEKISAARWISLASALGIISTLVYRNNGIRDPAVLGLVVVLIAAGLLAGRTGTIVIGVMIIGEIVLFGFLESWGVITNQFSNANFFADYLSTSLSIILITVLQWLVITRLNRNILNAEQEIKERESIENQLREAETRYRNLVEQIPAVIYIAEPGDQGKWHYVSPQIEELTGYPPEEWLENPDLWFSLIHPADRKITIEREMKAIIEGGNMPQTEYRLQTKAGAYVWVHDKSLRIIEKDLLQGFILDITARKIAEEQVQKRIAEMESVRGVSENLMIHGNLDSLIQQTGEQLVAMFQVDNLYIAILNNAESAIDFPYYYHQGKQMKSPPIRSGTGMTSSVIEMKRPLLINENWAEIAAQHGVIYFDGHPAKSSLTVPLMIGEKGIGAISIQDNRKENAFSENDVRVLATIAANLAVAIENTNLQESLKQELNIQEKLVTELEAKNAELERFTYTASHDLKSPLITIRGYLGYLERDARAGNFERMQKDVRRITEATDKMNHLLSDLLELSRIGRVMNEPEEIPFAEIVQESLKRVDGQLAEGRVTVNVMDELPNIHGDKERLIEVVQNLLDNACKFMGTQQLPIIEIGVKDGNGTNIFYVKDNGGGIKKEFHERVFGLFDKLDPNSSGTGVGLALVKRIVEIHGGNIWIESSEGKGTTFFFTLASK